MNRETSQKLTRPFRRNGDGLALLGPWSVGHLVPCSSLAVED